MPVFSSPGNGSMRPSVTERAVTIANATNLITFFFSILLLNFSR